MGTRPPRGFSRSWLKLKHFNLVNPRRKKGRDQTGAAQRLQTLSRLSHVLCVNLPSADLGSNGDSGHSGVQSGETDPHRRPAGGHRVGF